MAVLANALNVAGLIVLIHAIYSAHEHTTRHATASSSSAAIPPDVTIELLFSGAILCAGVVLAAAPLRPIRWREWAGEVERRQGSAEARREGLSNPFAGLEERAGFLDVRAKRKEYTRWVKDGAAASKS